MWNKEALHDLIDARFQDYQLIVVANREPYIHRYNGDQIECMLPASGMATALDPVLRACGGTWVGHGSGDADRVTVDERDHVRVPPNKPSYDLRRVWLTKEQEDGFYFGLSNEALWPLCHVTFTRPVFLPEHWAAYKEVNELYAKAVLEEAGDRPAFVWIQDYHFGLLPRLLKNANPKLIVTQFWHIPWPNPEVFRAFPWTNELLDGLLGNDLLGFHLRIHCQNFLDTVDKTLEAKVGEDRQMVTRGGQDTAVRPFPISIDFDDHAETAASAPVKDLMRHFRQWLELDGQLVGLGIDRLDYTKGIPERLRALDYLFEHHPEHRGRLTFVQIGVPSRSDVKAYRQLAEEIDGLVEEINRKWGSPTWTPIRYLKKHHDQHALMALHQLSHFMLVSSLHDGMNLVAKEYVASRNDDDGVLILSQFTGAARELTDALLVHPFSIESMAKAIDQSLTMPEAERKRRMTKLREAVASNNVYRWAGKVLNALAKFDFPEQD